MLKNSDILVFIQFGIRLFGFGMHLFLFAEPNLNANISKVRWIVKLLHPYLRKEIKRHLDSMSEKDKKKQTYKQ